MKLLRSVLEMAPIGLTSALEQSYLVRYPRRLYQWISSVCCPSTIPTRHDSPLIDISTSEHQQASDLSSAPWQQLSKEVSQQHPQPGLDVLQRQVFGVASTMSAELGLLVGDEEEEGANRGDDRVHVEIDVVAMSASGSKQGQRTRERRRTNDPIASARSFARLRVSIDEFSVPM